MTDFTMKKDADGIATITWDVADKSMNVMSIDGLEQLDALTDQALADDSVNAILQDPQLARLRQRLRQRLAIQPLSAAEMRWALVGMSAGGASVSGPVASGGRLRSRVTWPLLLVGAMAAAVLGAVVPGIEVEDVETADKTFPGFDRAWQDAADTGTASGRADRSPPTTARDRSTPRRSG